MEIKLKQKGFTLVELIIVISIISLIVVTTVKWPSRKTNLYAQVQKLTSDIQYVQFLAMSRDERYRIQFNQNSYVLTKPDANNTPINFPSVVQSPNTTHRNIVQLEAGITLSADTQSIIFDGQGTPYDHNSTVLDQPVQITLTLDETGQSETITLIPDTGKVEI
jgi:prepilin-type N-terminal cleavage/methylation domain-containing protein